MPIRPLLENLQRFGPWLTGALYLLLASGGLLIVAEPVRELVTFSFWLKTGLRSGHGRGVRGFPGVGQNARSTVGTDAE